MKNKDKRSKTFTIIIYLVIVGACLFLSTQVDALFNEEPSVIVSTDSVNSNTINGPNSGVSNPVGHNPPGLNKPGKNPPGHNKP